MIDRVLSTGFDLNISSDCLGLLVGAKYQAETLGNPTIFVDHVMLEALRNPDIKPAFLRAGLNTTLAQALLESALSQTADSEPLIPGRSLGLFRDLSFGTISVINEATHKAISNGFRLTTAADVVETLVTRKDASGIQAVLTTAVGANRDFKMGIIVGGLRAIPRAIPSS